MSADQVTSAHKPDAPVLQRTSADAVTTASASRQQDAASRQPAATRAAARAAG